MVPFPFGTLPVLRRIADRVTLENHHALAFRDSYSIAEDHSLVVPRQHVASVSDLGPAEQAAVWSLVAQARAQLQDDQHPDAFTIGINDGTAAGQTVPHAHVHVIPRWNDDVPDLRGGVSWVIAGKAARFAIKVRQSLSSGHPTAGSAFGSVGRIE